ncbi:hypothetical protein [Quadrisphaera setariae]|uniref:Uncharacterized protein n=1 Tax=Quadrisphaera setariae TaxID=2593304 RepID=A0A5C8ZFS0_9ACTN|nr:hypothetical protein [Quadrisphaera setariae]TXR56109.1 hypothetical protein FMM08_11800 [Quadrisphaera setariae]
MAAKSSAGGPAGRGAGPEEPVPPPDQAHLEQDDLAHPGSARPSSLTSLLWRREQVARCSGALSVYLGTTVAQAEALLLSEARRRGTPVGLLARRVLTDTAAASSWTAERCPVCEDVLQVEVLGGFGLHRELICPRHHDRTVSPAPGGGPAPGRR